MALSKEEDAELQRLGVLKQHGLLGGDMARLYETLRERDRRESVREPVSNTLWDWWG